MVQWGLRKGARRFRRGLGYFNVRDALIIADRLGIRRPTSSEFRRYGPFKAIALDCYTTYIVCEPLSSCLARYELLSKTLSSRVEGISSVSFVEQGEDL